MWKLWLAAQTVPVTIDMGDLQYLEGKSDAGTFVTVQGLVTATGTICSYTPANGKTFVLYRASYDISNDNTTNSVKAELKNDTTVRETFATTASGSTALLGKYGHYVESGDELAGNGAKTYSILATVTAGTFRAYGTIVGFIK